MKIADLPMPRVIRLGASRGVTPDASQPVLWCRRCGDTYSALPGDYADRDPEETLTCSDCGGPFVLAETRTVYVPYDPTGDDVAWLLFYLQVLWERHGKGAQ